MEPVMEPIMTRAEAARHIEAARLRTGRTWAGIAEDLGTPLVWTTAALLGQHPMTTEQAAAACALLGLDDSVAESLTTQPNRGTDPETMRDPAIYRFSEALGVDSRGVRRRHHERDQLHRGHRASARSGRRPCDRHLRWEVSGLPVVTNAP